MRKKTWAAVGLCLLSSTVLGVLGQETPQKFTKPSGLLFYGEPKFETAQWDFTTLLKPHPSEILDFSYAGIYEPNQRLILSVMASGEPYVLPREVVDSASPIGLRILGPVRNFRVAGENDPYPGEFQALVAQIAQDLKTDEEKALAVFAYIDQNIRQWWFPAEGYRDVRLHSEEVGRQIWGYGYGFCSDVARIAVAMWESVGLPGRIVGVDPFHTVAEVYYDEDWHLFDVQHRTFWRDTDGQIASAKDLAGNTQLFWQGLDKDGLDPIGYPPLSLAYWYENASFSYHESIQWKEDHSFSLNLRAGEFFEFDYVGKPYIYRPDFWMQAYGEKTLRRDPPWPYLGQHAYVPHWYGAKPTWQTLKTKDGRIAYLVTMENPYVYTEGFLHLPALAGQAEVYVYAHDTFHFVGPLLANGARLGRHMAGTTRFAVAILVNQPLEQPDVALAKLEIHAKVQISHLAMPDLTQSKGRLKNSWDEGQPTTFLWYREDAPDLAVEWMGTGGDPAQTGAETALHYRIVNHGAGKSLPTAVVLYNTTTRLFSENLETVGRFTIPPLNPGDAYDLFCPWVANTRQTWYGQNPFIQNFFLQVDPDKLHPDLNRSNQMLRHSLHLRDDNGQEIQLPGYTAYPPVPGKTNFWKGLRLH